MTHGERCLLLASRVLYLATRRSHPPVVPLSFFCDEAIHGVLTRDLAANGFRDSNGGWLPSHFQRDGTWKVRLSIYLPAPLRIRRSIWFPRATSVVAGVLTPLGIAALLRFGSYDRHRWFGIFVFCVMPAWFIHSRTAFETVLMVACYAGFLAASMAYRDDDRRIAAAILVGAAPCGSYANRHEVMVVSGTRLFLGDIRYHLSRPP